MGFDIECIIDIQTYPGEYFCPVCRTLVYPNEALQSQCSHLYCKPCLAHIANGSKACPYDGYLVTESDSKPLIDSDKVLVEKIGKVKVHCLFFRSGCTWEGTLADCTSHCSECSFGNSPVICNRCGIQIIHRQVHDHAQSCPGAYEAQPSAGVISGTTSSGPGAVTNATDLNQTATQPGPVSQSQNPQNAIVSLQSGQNPNQPPIANPQVPSATPSSVPSTEQWYQQQYQQYYQQYAGYNPYQQPQQQYYSLQQQQPFQQYQQNPLPVHGQPSSHVYTQPLAQPLAQVLVQPPQSQPLPQHHPQPQAQAQAQPQHILQTQQPTNFQQLAQGQAQPLPVVPQVPSHVQVQPQGQPQLRPPIQVLPPNYQGNPQQQHPLMRPQAQPPSFPLPSPHGQPTQPPTYAQTVGLQPVAQQTQIHQPPLHMHPSNAPQAHLQPQIQAQPQFQNQTSVLSHVQIQQAPQYHNQYSQVRPPPPNPPTAISAPPQPQHLPPSSVSGFQSFPHPQPIEQIQSGTSQQYPIQLQPTSGSFHPVKMQGQAPQQPALMRPPPTHGSFLVQQPSTMLTPHTQVPGTPSANQQISAVAQPPMHNPQHGTVMQTVQHSVPTQVAPLPPYGTPSKSLHQPSQFPQQLPLQPQLHAYGFHQPPQSQNYGARPMVLNEGTHPQNYPQSSVAYGAVANTGQTQPGSNISSTIQNSANSAVLDKNDSFSSKHVPYSGMHDQGIVEKNSVGSDVEPSKEEVILNNVSDLHRTVSKDGMKNEFTERASEKLSGSISFESRSAEINAGEENGRPRTGSHMSQLAEHESKVDSSSKDFDMVPHISVPRPEAQVGEHPSLVAGPQGSGILPLAGQTRTPNASAPGSGRAPGHFGHPSKIFESPKTPQVSLMTTTADPLRCEGQSGVQDPVRSSESAILKDSKVGSSFPAGSGERILHRQIYDEQSFRRTNGETDTDSFKFGFRDHSNPNSLQPARPTDQVPLDNTLPKSSYDVGTKTSSGVLDPLSRLMPPPHPSAVHIHIDSLGPNTDFGRQTKHFPSVNPDGNYLGISSHGFAGPSGFPRGSSAFDDINVRQAPRFGDAVRPFNPPLDPLGNSFNGRRFPHIPAHNNFRGDEIDGPNNLGFGEHMTRGPAHNHIRSDDTIRQGGPGPRARGEFSGPGYLSGQFMSETGGPGAFSGHPRVGELGGQGNFRHHIPFGEPIRGERPSVPFFGDPGLRSSHTMQGFPNSGSFVGEGNYFDQSRKRKPVSMGWCRICKFDCETVEGLEMHSQTREHQNMAMDMVKIIMQNNKKKLRTFAGHGAYDGESRNRKLGVNGRGSKP